MSKKNNKTAAKTLGNAAKLGQKLVTRVNENHKVETLPLEEAKAKDAAEDAKAAEKAAKATEVKAEVATETAPTAAETAPEVGKETVAAFNLAKEVTESPVEAPTEPSKLTKEQERINLRKAKKDAQKAAYEAKKAAKQQATTAPKAEVKVVETAKVETTSNKPLTDAQKKPEPELKPKAEVKVEATPEHKAPSSQPVGKKSKGFFGGVEEVKPITSFAAIDATSDKMGVNNKLDANHQMDLAKLIYDRQKDMAEADTKELRRGMLMQVDLIMSMSILHVNAQYANELEQLQFKIDRTMLEQLTATLATLGISLPKALPCKTNANQVELNFSEAEIPADVAEEAKRESANLVPEVKGEAPIIEDASPTMSKEQMLKNLDRVLNQKKNGTPYNNVSDAITYATVLFELQNSTPAQVLAYLLQFYKDNANDKLALILSSLTNAYCGNLYGNHNYLTGHVFLKRNFKYTDEELAEIGRVLVANNIENKFVNSKNGSAEIAEKAAKFFKPIPTDIMNLIANATAETKDEPASTVAIVEGEPFNVFNTKQQAWERITQCKTMQDAEVPSAMTMQITALNKYYKKPVEKFTNYVTVKK